jgi:hypothetical protein
MTLGNARALVLGLAIMMGAAQAKAITIESGDSTESLGSFTGELTYSFSSDTSATLTVTLNNTSTTEDSLYITAFAICDPAGSNVTGAELASGPAGWETFLDASVSPYNDSDDNFGASSTDGVWLGGGSPNGGIAIGDSETFVITLSGSGFSSLTAADFVTDDCFLVRMRGEAGSDKIEGVPGGEEPPGNPVPEPSTVTLAALGAAGFLKKKFAKKA